MDWLILTFVVYLLFGAAGFVIPKANSRLTVATIAICLFISLFLMELLTIGRVLSDGSPVELQNALNPESLIWRLPLAIFTSGFALLGRRKSQTKRP
jgi:hypothetical protein